MCYENILCAQCIYFELSLFCETDYEYSHR